MQDRSAADPVARIVPKSALIVVFDNDTDDGRLVLFDGLHDANALAFEAEVDAIAARQPLTLDLSACAFIDVAGMVTLERLRTRYGERIAIVLPTSSAGCVISVSGEFDMSTSPHLETVLAPVIEWPRIVLDCSAVEYMDSSALAVLVRIHNARAARGLEPGRIIGLRAGLRRIFSITRLDSIWTLGDTLGELVPLTSPGIGSMRRNRSPRY